MPPHDGGQGGHDGDGRRVNQAAGDVDFIAIAPPEAGLHELATGCGGDGKTFVTKGSDKRSDVLVAQLNPLIEIRDG